MQPCSITGSAKPNRAAAMRAQIVELARSVNDITTLMLALPSLGLNLAAGGNYAEADAIFAEVRHRDPASDHDLAFARDLHASGLALMSSITMAPKPSRLKPMSWRTRSSTCRRW